MKGMRVDDMSISRIASLVVLYVCIAQRFPFCIVTLFEYHSDSISISCRPHLVVKLI